MDVSDLGPAESFAAGAVGRPGRRTFYIRVVAGSATHWFLLEKEQVAALASQSMELLVESGIQADEQAVERLLAESPELEEPSAVTFRVGAMALRAATDAGLITVILQSTDEEEDETEARAVSFVVAPEQLRAMALAGLQAVSAGRPICPRCRLPEDPEGHDCPAVNGHRRR